LKTAEVLGPGRTALVTGASRGIGPLIAKEIARQGNHVVLTGRSLKDLQAVAHQLRSEGADVSFLPIDLVEPGATEALVQTVERERGGVDVLINNAGGDPQREFDRMTLAENLDILQLNLVAPLTLAHAVLPGMFERGQGHIVNISALAGRVAFPYTEAYAAAKDGLIGFTRVLRNDYRARGVSASVLILGPVAGAGQGQRTADQLGLKLPLFATVSAAVVARAVVDAIRRDRAELVLMPGPGRLMKATMDFFPGLGPAINRISGSTATMQRVIEYRKEQRHVAVS
jgi:short-subunit dehydrogenase